MRRRRRIGAAAADVAADLAPPAFGRHLGTTAGGEPLRSGDLGVSGPAALRLTTKALVLRRPGHTDLVVPHADLRGARGDADGLVIAWVLAGHQLLTRFAADDPSAHDDWVAALEALAGSETTPVAPLPAPAPSEPEPAGSFPAPPLVGRARPAALLVLEDGRWWRGEAFGAPGESLGEAVFNTAMTGYQETLTDPSYHRQVVVMTAPHVGNTGLNDVDPESDRIWVAGFVVRDPARVASSWRAERSLDAGLRSADVVGVAGVDTRAITRHLRDRGAMRCGVSSVESDPDALLDRVRSSPGMVGLDLAREVSTPQAYVVPAAGERRWRVAAVDLGLKRATSAYLAAQGAEVVVLPATASAEEILATDPDGVFFSNGPGDPAATGYAVEALRGVLGRRPVFGICLGNQLLGRALGLDTFKLKFGHRGVNQPVQDLADGRVAITSHNHGFAVAAPGGDVRAPFTTAYGRAVVSHVDLNDGVVEGLRCLDIPAFSVQYHPEAAPGPHDATGLFAQFASLMATAGVRS